MEIPEYRFTRDHIRALDRAAVNDYHIPVLILMENAARNIAIETLLFELDQPNAEFRPTLIICGKGNNGGDGLATARHLINTNLPVAIALAFDPENNNLSPEVKTHLTIAQNMNIPIIPLDPDSPDETLNQFLDINNLDQQPLLIIDALLGTGITTPPREPIPRIINWINTQNNNPDTTVVAIDIPTGLDCDTGEPLGEQAVQANLTICLAGYKNACFQPQAKPYLGTITLGEIGIPHTLLKQFGQPVNESDLPWLNDTTPPNQ